MPDGIAWQLDQVVYTPGDDRILDALGWTPGSALLARPGVRPGPGLEVTVGGTPEALNLAPGGGVITDPAGGGSYRFAIPSALSRQLPARPATGNSRIVDLVARILNADARPADVAREVRIELLAGAEGASPAAPTLPAGYLRLRRATIPSSGSVALSMPAPRTVALGGVLPVATAAERDAIVAPYDGMTIYREDTGRQEIRTGGTWQPLAHGDTGWLDLPLATGYTPPSGASPQIRLFNGVVYLRGGITRTAVFAPGVNVSPVAVGGVPAAMRPARSGNDVIAPLVMTAGATPGAVGSVAPDGSLSITGGTNGAGNGGGTVFLAGLSGYLPG